MIFVGKVLLVGSLDENSRERERDAEVDESGTRDTDAASAAAAFSSQAKSLRQVSKAKREKKVRTYIDGRSMTGERRRRTFFSCRLLFLLSFHELHAVFRQSAAAAADDVPVARYRCQLVGY